MISTAPTEPGFFIVHSKGCSYEEALNGVVCQVRSLEKDWQIDFISNTSCKGDDDPRVTNLYHATQTIVLKPKKGK